MGKASKWLRSFLTGKKEKEKEKGCNNQFCSISIDKPMTPMINPPNTPREKKRWSFRRLSATKDTNSMDSIPTNSPSVMQAMLESENEQKKHAMAMTTAADAVIRLASSATTRSSVIEEAAAIKIQSLFRSYLARKALCALRGLVKLQALVRGHLVRKQATTTLRCMQALVTVQARARTQRIRKAEETQSIHRKSTQDNGFRQAYNMDRGVEENVKIVEMDLGDLRGNSKGRYSYSTHTQVERADHRFSTHSTGHHAHSKQEHQYQMSPAQSALTDMSPRAYSGHFEDYYFGIRQSSPQYYLGVSRPDSTKVPFTSPKPEYEDSISHEYPFFPNYMANTESFKAKARSQSAPKQRPDAYERQPSRRKASIEAKIVPRVVRMQRSSSHVGSTARGYKNPWSIKLDRSSVSLKDSECGSSSTVLTNNNYCRSLLAYEMSTY